MEPCEREVKISAIEYGGKIEVVWSLNHIDFKQANNYWISPSFVALDVTFLLRLAREDRDPKARRRGEQGYFELSIKCQNSAECSLEVSIRCSGCDSSDRHDFHRDACSPWYRVDIAKKEIMVTLSKT